MKSNRKNSTSGYTGVTFDYKALSWRSQKSVNGMNQYIGNFATKEEASEARIRYDKKLKNESKNVILLDKAPIQINSKDIQVILFSEN